MRCCCFSSCSWQEEEAEDNGGNHELRRTLRFLPGPSKPSYAAQKPDLTSRSFCTSSSPFSAFGQALRFKRGLCATHLRSLQSSKLFALDKPSAISCKYPQHNTQHRIQLAIDRPQTLTFFCKYLLQISDWRFTSKVKQHIGGQTHLPR